MNFNTDNLSIDKLPSMPSSAFNIMQMVLDPEISLEILSKGIEQDIALSTKIIQLVNTPRFATSQSILDLKHAVVVLGLRTIKNLALSLCVMDSLKGALEEDIYNTIFNLSICNATTTQLLSTENKLDNVNDSFFCGLVQYFGLFVLADVMKERYGELYQESLDKGLRFTTVLEENIHVKHNEIGYNLARKWRLPQRVCDTLKYQETERLSSITEASESDIKIFETIQLSMLATEIFISPGKALNIEKFKASYQKFYNSEPSKAEKKLTRLGRKINDALAKMSIDLPTQTSYTAVLKEANKELSSINFKYEAMYHEVNLVNEQLSVANKKLKGKNKQLMQVAAYDFLTGLHNRARFEKELKVYLSLSQRRNHPMAIIFIDIDNFKAINDEQGSPIGDELLSLAAKKIVECCRDDESVARIGGDAFGIILPNLKTEQDPSYLAERILKTFQGSFTLNNTVIKGVTPSLGIACFPFAGTSVQQLIKSANAALACVKKAGKNNFQYFTKNFSLKSERRLALTSAFTKALSNDEFRMVYQPVVDIHKNHIIGFEALMRWNSLALGPISPDEFIPYTEENGKMPELGDWGMNDCMQQISHWKDKVPNDLFFSLNISGKQFFAPDFFETITGAMSLNNVNAPSIIIELPEKILMKHKSDSTKILNGLVNAGIKTSIDDFGVADSSFALLKGTPFHALKIDASYIKEIDSNPDSACIVKTIIALANNLGLKTIAEGVEKKAQLDLLMTLGCQYAQGYYFSKPIEAKEVPELIKCF